MTRHRRAQQAVLAGWWVVAGAAIWVVETARAAEGAARTVVEWRFDGEAEEGEWQGKAKPSEAEVAGPRAPRYPGFAPENRAAFFPGRDAFWVVRDEEKGGAKGLRFGLGETITLEAWVKIQSISPGQQAYLLGKGRHGELGQGLGEMNQNYAMRLRGVEQGAQLGFLFTSENPAQGGKRDWHRWWSRETLPAAGWHHVAIVYTFGKADSLRAMIDGAPVEGVWDMGGATALPPVQDADDLVLGTGYKRSAGESYAGWMDNVAIHRGGLDEETLRLRYAHEAPPPPVTPEMAPEGKVLVQISERGVPLANSWPEEPEVTESYEEEAFGFFEWPQKYVSTGVRADRANPSLVRAAARVQLPAGEHRWLLRGRGAARLYVDGRKVLETPFPSGDTGGHGVVASQDEYLDLGPDFRFVPPGNRETWGTLASGGGEHFVVLETMIGGVAGKQLRRPEFGETVVAISREGEETWELLSPGERRVAYTDEGWAVYEEERRVWLDRVNAEAREGRRAEHAAYWNRRREAAKQWLGTVEAVPVPELPEGYPGHNEIDAFLGARIAEVAAGSEGAKRGGVDYHAQVKPILEAKCYDCHQGGKAKGGLQLDQRSATLQGGKSDGPAVAPGDLEGSALLHRVRESAGDDIMPPKGDPLTAEEIVLLERWIEQGASWPDFEMANFVPTPLTDEWAFLRRVTLDTVGVGPTEEEVAEFLAAEPERRRAEVIERLLGDPRWADQWMGYWQDVLAENPNIINPTLNNTGPFRWWIYESLRDNKPADLLVTELVRMEGSERFGGPAGFGTASQNDVPFAEKGMILSAAFLGVEMKCARCHDAPAHVAKQEDLFQLGAMLQEGPLQVPATSSVPMDRIHQTGRQPLIEVTLPPGSTVEPGWPFAEFCPEEAGVALAEDAGDTRDRLAALITAPQNERFAQVMANRVWQRLMGRGIVASVADWEKAGASHPELLRWLGRKFVASGYDMKAVARLILQSHAYQRAVDPALRETGPLFVAPAPRRLSAEQIVDGLFHATGKRFQVEEVSLDLDSVRTYNNSITLGKPRRAWMLASTSNERDRPSLSLPRIQAVASVMETFGWRGARQDPVSLRPGDPNVLQPAILANGTMGVWLTRLSDDHGITQLALEEQPLERFVERLFVRLLTRLPSGEERTRYMEELAEGYENRIIPGPERALPNEAGPRVPVRYVSWSNHLDGLANVLAQEKEAEARRGDPPTAALRRDWRLRLEDVMWALLNSPEWIYTP